MRVISLKESNEQSSKEALEYQIKNSNFTKLLNQDIGDEIIDNNEFVYIKGSFYQFKNFTWELLDDITIKRTIHNKLKELKLQISKQSVVSVSDYLKIELDTPPKQNKNEIFFKNGFYNPVSNEFTLYSENNKEDYIINYIKADYRKDAKCNRWVKFIDEIFENDPDKEMKKQLLQEFLGYCLTQDNKMQKSLFLYGNGANGKSVILEMLGYILSHENVSNVPFNKLNDEKYIIQLNNKLVNILSEIDPKAKNSFDAFKRIIGGDTLTGRNLYKDPVQFENTAKLIFGVNHLPLTMDDSDGFFRRIIVLKFNNQFKGDNADIHLIDKLKEEQEGIIQWMIEGLLRLNQNKKFTVPESSSMVLQEYREENDSILYFANNYCKFEEGVAIPHTELYERYRGFCKEYKFTPLSKLHFKKELINKFPVVEYKPKNINGRTHRCLINIF